MDNEYKDRLVAIRNNMHSECSYARINDICDVLIDMLRHAQRRVEEAGGVVEQATNEAVIKREIEAQQDATNVPH